MLKMNKFNIAILILTFMAMVTTMSETFAVEQISNLPMKLKAEEATANMEMVIKDNFVKAKFASAENRFSQGNVKASYIDFEDIISRAHHDDYVFLTYGIKMAEYGFFDLSDSLFKKLDNNLYTANYVKDIKNFYYPFGMVNEREIIALADAYAGIVYNNLAIETTSELLSSTKLEESDYKNYLIALGYYKSNNLQQALKYINNAIMENNRNINYKILQAKIYADSKKPKQALKTLGEIKKVSFKTVDFQTKIDSAEQYVLYKISKDDSLRDYHLSYYYYLQNRSLLATKVLQAAILQSKQHAPLIFGLLGKIYYENDEPLKAQEFAQRAFSDDNKNYLANLTLADINYGERKYEEALKLYKSAHKISKKESLPIVGIAKSYFALTKTKKSAKLYEKMLKKNGINEELLIGALKVFPQRTDEYLPQIASVDISNNDIWLALAGVAIKDGNYTMAETYLNNSYYIDENNFKYYYYLSKVLRAKGDINKSEQLLIQCSRLNSDYEANINSGYSNYEK